MGDFWQSACLQPVRDQVPVFPWSSDEKSVDFFCNGHEVTYVERETVDFEQAVATRERGTFGLVQPRILLERGMNGNDS